MRRYYTALTIIAALLLIIGQAVADGPLVSAEGKLFGMRPVLGGPEGDDQGPPIEVLYPVYENSAATFVSVGTHWEACEPSSPGTGESKYDFSVFDNQIFMKSAKTKICSVGLWNKWAEEIKPDDPDRYWQLAENFVKALTKHANEKGIKYFQMAGNEFDLLGRADWATLHVEPLKHVYTAIKSVSQDNIVIAGNLSYGGDVVVQALYDAGIKGYFDVLDIHAYSDDARTGVDIFQIVAAHRAMARNGDTDKKIFLGEGWGPKRQLPGIYRKSHKEPPTQEEIEALRGFVENGYRNMLTERDIYDPDWLLGARFFTMNDNYGQGQWKGRAEYVDEDGDGNTDYILLDGYRFPPGTDMEPRFFNGALVDFEGKPKADLIDIFIPDIPKHTFDGSIVMDGPGFNYVTGKPYKLELTITNLGDKEMKLEKFGVRKHGGAWQVDAKPDGEMPTSVAAGQSAVGSFTITFPAEAAGSQTTLIGELNYSVDGRKYLTDCWMTLTLTPELEITLLPSRAVLDAQDRSKRIGMSVINHADTAFDGKITLSSSRGISFKPPEFETSIDPFGLEAFVFSVTADEKAAPGHYAVFVDVGGRVKDWVAVEVPVTAKKPKSAVVVDGKLDDWQDAAEIEIVRLTAENKYQRIGKGWFAYDVSGFYAAFEIDDEKHVQNQQLQDIWREDCIQMAFDPLMDGAMVASGMYKPDDYEYGFAQTNYGPVVSRSKAAMGKTLGRAEEVDFAFGRHGGKSVYEIRLPWSELAPFALDASRERENMLALSVVVNDSDGAGRDYVEWGGGIADKKDPRRFVPVVLAR